jgi:hypothetical protein
MLVAYYQVSLALASKKSRKIHFSRSRWKERVNKGGNVAKNVPFDNR